MTYIILIAVLITASCFDIRRHRIPDWLTLPAIGVGIYLTHNWLGALTGAGCITIMGCLGLVILKQETMGGGDVKLMAVVGAFLGWRMALLSFFIAPLFALLYGGLRTKRQKEIPYAPAISLAAGVSYIWAGIGF